MPRPGRSTRSGNGARHSRPPGRPLPAGGAGLRARLGDAETSCVSPGAPPSLTGGMNLLATLMATMTVLTCSLFANALAAADPAPAPARIELATYSASHQSGQ